MSASSGLLAKGEKGKSKFQSLDINNLYKSTESEPTQQKGSLLRTKNGMQSLGKVPTARRPPANLPSLKAENSGNEPAVSLVPAGAAGWGSKPGETPPPQQPQQPPPNAVAAASAPVAAAATAAPVAVVTPVVMVPPPHEQALHNLMPGADKSWSAIMAREQVPNFLAHQSPQFQHEFPKLASEGGSAPPGKPGDAQYGPGPSLRPQTEGSWTGGGGRALSGAAAAGVGPNLGPGPHHTPDAAARNNLGPHPPAAVPMGLAGPVAPVPPLPTNFPYRPLQHPPFMMPPRAGFPGGAMGGMRPRYPFPAAGRPEPDELVTRPIIRDEELNKMDDLSRDPGWAASEDMDYNQKLAFSDSEDGPTGDSKKKDVRKERSRGKDDDKERNDRDMDRRSDERVGDKRAEWGRSRYGPEDDRRADEERLKHRELDDERRKVRDDEEDRRKVREEVANAVQVARQRKDEAKRYDEPKRGDRRDWDDKRDLHESDKRDHNKRDAKYERDGKMDPKREEPKRDEHKFDLKRDEKYERDVKRDDYRGRADDRRDFRRPPQYNKLPPRFQAQVDRMNPQHRQTGSPQPAPSNNSYEQQHWGRRFGSESSEESRDRHAPDTRDRHASDSRDRPAPDARERNAPDARDRHTPDTYADRYKGPQRERHYNDDRRHFDRKESESDRHSEDNYKKREEPQRIQKDVRKEPSEEREVWRNDEDRRPQRPDSRDSRTSRESRHSREDKHDSHEKHEPKPRIFPPAEEERKEEPVKVPTPAPREHATPPRENKLPVVEDKNPPVVKEEVPPVQATPINDVQPVANDKESKEEKSPQDDRQKNKSGRGRWGSAPTNSSTYVRNGNRGERRRKISGGAKPEQESCSSGEGGSELDKGEKEERNRETKRTGEPTGRGGFAPSGQPSRRGRGSGRVRGGSTAPRSLDGYGPPPVKASFPQSEPAAVEEEEEDPTKQKQAALNAGIVGGAARAAAAAANPPAKFDKPLPAKVNRSQSQRDGTHGKPARGGRRSGGRDGEDWETVSNSDGEEKRGDGRARRGGGTRGAPRPFNNRSGNGPSGNAGRPNQNAEAKDDKAPVDVGKAKSADGESDATQSSGAGHDSRPKKDVNRKDGSKGGKPEHGTRNGPGKERPDRTGERRGKPPQIVPPAPNPNGPQPLMSQVVNPPPQMKNYSSSTWRQTPVLPPRLQKQQEQRMQANANANSDSHDLPKINSMYTPKTENMQPNAWDKPLPTRSAPLPLPTIEQTLPLADVSNARSSPAAAPVSAKMPPRPEAMLDDSAAPVQTIIFENTNLKAGTPAAFTAGLKPAPVRVSKGNEWKTSEELFGKGADLGGSESVVAEHSIKSQQPLYTEHGLELLNSEMELNEENAADLKHRLAGTKQLWDKNDDEQTGAAVFPGSFCQDTSMDGFSKSVDGVVVPDDCSGLMHTGEVVYNPQSYSMSKHDHTNSSNVCKVKPQQQPVLTSGHSPLGHTGQSPLSPPPSFNSAQGPFGYPQGLGSSSAGAYSGMPAIPSPPAGHPYSSQALQQNANLFAPFSIDRQFNSQFSANPYGLSGLGGTSSYNQPPIYMPHAAPPSDVFSSYRVQHPSQHNPNTVLMTSSANSLMSASVKQPSSQNIGVIGSKAPTYQQNNQVYIPYEAMPLQTYLNSAGMVQRSTPVQQPAPNFYSNSAAPQTGFYSAPNTGLGQPMPSLQQPYNRQGFLNQTANMSFSSQPQLHMDMGYRNAGAVGPSYLKSGVGNNAALQQSSDVLASVFNSAPPKTRPQKQMSQPPPQQSPTQMSVNKFGNYSASQLSGPPPQQQPQQQRMPGPQSNMAGLRSAPRYPTPIQRPLATSYRGTRPNNGTGPHQHNSAKPYYDAQDVKLDEGNDMNSVEESSGLNCEPKMSDASNAGKQDGVEEPAAVATE